MSGAAVSSEEFAMSNAKINVSNVNSGGGTINQVGNQITFLAFKDYCYPDLLFRVGRGFSGLRHARKAL
jgi:hypothetical protein